MNKQSAIVRINRGLEQYADTFSTESEEYLDLEFQLTKLLGYPQLHDRKYGAAGYSRSKQFDYKDTDLQAALQLVQGANTAAAQAQGYYEALADAGAEITRDAVRLMAKNLQWIRENKDEIYDLLKGEYGAEWKDSDTREAYQNSYNNTVLELYAIIARDAEEQESLLHNEPIGFLKNINRIKKELEITEEQRRQYARMKRENTRTARYTQQELREMRKWGNADA